MNRKSICLSLEEKDIATFDNLVDFLTLMNGYRFTRTSALLFLIKFYRDNFDYADIIGELSDAVEKPLPF